MYYTYLCDLNDVESIICTNHFKIANGNEDNVWLYFIVVKNMPDYFLFSVNYYFEAM